MGGQMGGQNRQGQSSIDLSDGKSTNGTTVTNGLNSGVGATGGSLGTSSYGGGMGSSYGGGYGSSYGGGYGSSYGGMGSSYGGYGSSYGGGYGSSYGGMGMGGMGGYGRMGMMGQGQDGQKGFLMNTMMTLESLGFLIGSFCEIGRSLDQNI
jgi:peroxin-13